jgi:predicted permease
VVAQVALSLVLLVGVGLLVSSLARISRTDPGFEPEGLYTFAVAIPGTDYDWPAEAGHYYRSVQERVTAIPGVEATGVVWPMPFSGTWSGEVEAGAGVRRSLGVVPYYLATEEYFATARIPLWEGRLFGEGDARHSVLLTEAAARRAFPDGSALGRIITANPWGGAAEEFEVIGVVGDVRETDLSEPTRGGVYFDARGWSWVDWEVHVIVRTGVPAGTLVPAIRAAVAELDANVPVSRTASMTERMEAGTATARFVLALLGVFAGAAGMLAVVGLYGVVSYTVGFRRKEFGIRVALGSARSGIERMVVGRAVLVAGVGVGLGVVASVALGGVLEAHLFEVEPGDPLTIVVAAACMAGAATLASWLPARRAGRTDPAEVLKVE